jgi:predicted ATP-grasp superfamily ATP-dependent carboligase
MRALILDDGVQRSTLTASRALARTGWVVGVGSPDKGFAAWSRNSSRWHWVPAPADDTDGFVRATNEAIASGRYEIVFGSGDAEILALSYRRDDIDATVPYPHHRTVEYAHDKLMLAHAAAGAGVATPRTVEATEEELAAIEGPVIVKARMHWVPGAVGTPGHMEAMLAPGRAEATRRAAQISVAGGRPLLQDNVEGDLLAYVAMVAPGGSVLAHIQQLADRRWPPLTGVSARAVTTRVDDSLARHVKLLLDDLGWFGLAELQFLRPDGEEPQLVDLNGRFYGSMALALASGINLPAIWANLATGRPFSVPGTARSGTRYQWLEGDLRRSWIERRGGLACDAWNTVVHAPRAAHSIWSASDPWPAIRHSGRLIGRAVRKFAR